jgi:hypothetical protein
MSFIAVANAFISPNQAQGWTTTWSFPTWPGWPGIVLVQAQPISGAISLACSTPSVSEASNGEYSFTYTVTNSSSNYGWYNLYLESGL